MEKKFDIKVLKGGPEYATTHEDWFAIPYTVLSVSKKFSGKTVSISQFCQIQHAQGKLDRIIMISPTYEQNKHCFVGLPIDEENDIIQPSVESAQIVMDKLDQEALEYDQYKEKLQKWKDLQTYLKTNKNIEDLDDELLMTFGSNLEKPKPKYPNNRKPVIVCVMDDCQGTEAFSSKSKLSYLTIKHRHLGLTVDGAIGCNLIIMVQTYMSSSLGLPRSVRSNMTLLCLFQNRNQKELDQIAAECSGEVSPEVFLKLHEKACSTPYMAS